MQTKYKFKIGDLNNTENLTSHYITYIEKKKLKNSSAGGRAGKQTQLIKSNARLDMRVTIRFFLHLFVK